MSNNQKLGDDIIYDARSLGAGKFAVLGIQHVFAMFGATVLVPLLTGLDVSVALLFAGIGTLLFHLVTGRKVPVFLGSSFAFIGGYAAIAPLAEDGSASPLLPYACFAVAVAGLMYLIVAVLFKMFGAGRVMKFFPPVVTGPIIIAIGLTLSPSAINNCATNWPIALVAILVVIICNIWGYGMIKIIPILLGVVASYLVAAVTGIIDFTPVAEAPLFGIPVVYEKTVFSLFTGGNLDMSLLIASLVTIVPIVIATMMEHIGDISAISGTVGQNFIKDPGLHRTLVGDGLATFVASLFGGPANTTYGENTGVLTLTKVYDPSVIRLAAVIAIVLSFCSKFSAIIEVMPSATVGGISVVLYGMISAVGVRNLVDSHVDFSKNRNVMIAAIILVLALGISNTSAGALVFTVGSITISLSGLACGSLAGIILNAVLPGKDYVFDDEMGSRTGLDLQLDQGENLSPRNKKK